MGKLIRLVWSYIASNNEYLYDVLDETKTKTIKLGVERGDIYSISQEICTRFLLCCALLWLYIDWFSHIHQAYFAGTVAI